MTRHASSWCTSWCTSILLTTAIAAYAHLISVSQSATGDVSFSSGSVLSTIHDSSEFLASCQPGEAISCLARHPQWLRQIDHQNTPTNEPLVEQSSSTTSNQTPAERSRYPLISLDPGQTTQRLTGLKRWIDQWL